MIFLLLFATVALVAAVAVAALLLLLDLTCAPDTPAQTPDTQAPPSPPWRRQRAAPQEWKWTRSGNSNAYCNFESICAKFIHLHPSQGEVPRPAVVERGLERLEVTQKVLHDDGCEGEEAGREATVKKEIVKLSLLHQN